MLAGNFVGLGEDCVVENHQVAVCRATLMAVWLLIFVGAGAQVGAAARRGRQSSLC